MADCIQWALIAALASAMVIVVFELKELREWLVEIQAELEEERD